MGGNKAKKIVAELKRLNQLTDQQIDRQAYDELSTVTLSYGAEG